MAQLATSYRSDAVAEAHEGIDAALSGSSNAADITYLESVFERNSGCYRGRNPHRVLEQMEDDLKLLGHVLIHPHAARDRATLVRTAAGVTGLVGIYGQPPATNTAWRHQRLRFRSMRAFNFKQGKAPWDSGTLLHWYVEVDWDDPRHDALAQLVTDSNQTLLDAGFPVTPVEHRWLHITIDQISRPAHLIDLAERDKLVAEVSHRVASIAPFTIMIGSVLSYASGAVADTHPDHQLAALHTAARDGTRTTLGDDACQYEFGIQHLTTAYAYAEADSDAAQRLLRRVRPSHAPLHINAVHLVDVTADPQAKTITWERVTQVPLGTAL